MARVAAAVAATLQRLLLHLLLVLSLKNCPSSEVQLEAGRGTGRVVKYRKSGWTR